MSPAREATARLRRGERDEATGGRKGNRVAVPADARELDEGVLVVQDREVEEWEGLVVPAHVESSQQLLGDLRERLLDQLSYHTGGYNKTSITLWEKKGYNEATGGVRPLCNGLAIYTLEWQPAARGPGSAWRCEVITLTPCGSLALGWFRPNLFLNTQLDAQLAIYT